MTASHPPLRAVFMGTPDFAATILERLLGSELLEIAAVYTQPDRPAGRGKKPCAPPVKELALARGIPVEQPLHFRQDALGDEAVARLSGYAPDLLLVAAYGLILPQRVLDIPGRMPLNVHASLLPKYRGAAPIQRAIMQGEPVTGVTIMRMEAGLDTGPILLQRAVAIGIDDDSASLHEELAAEGAELLLLTLEKMTAGALPCAIAQDDSRATYASKLRKEEGLLDLSQNAQTLHAHIRALTPWPGASLLLCREGQEDLSVQVEAGIFPLKEEMIQAFQAGRNTETTERGIPTFVAGALLVPCGGHVPYAFTSFRPAGRKKMDATAFYNGYIAGACNPHFVGRVINTL